MLAATLSMRYSPESIAQVTPNIAFLNPSNFATAGDAGIIVSDNQPTRPREGDDTYRLSAWVANTPANPAVEFELLRSGISLATIDASRRIGEDTFEADWNIPDTLPDGPYTLRATLASDGIGVDSVDQSITINRLAERVEIANNLDDSSGNERFGSFAALATQLASGEGGTSRQLPTGDIDGLNTGASPGHGTSRVRAFYSVTSPGLAPEWIVCGTEFAPGDASLSSAANNGVRCRLQSATPQTSVTAVALLANSSNEGPYDARLNQAGDAVRILESYAQTPAKFEIVGSPVSTMEADDTGQFGCILFEGRLTDQLGREIVGANIDVHAVGPSDRLKFDTGPFSDYDFQVPDRGTHATEAGYDCFGGHDRETPGMQGEHQIVAGPDIKHLEADAKGTTDNGVWGFSLRIPAEDVSEHSFSSNFIMWVDESDDGTLANDDGCASTEVSVFGSVGWGKATDVVSDPNAYRCTPSAPPCPGAGDDTESVPEGCPTPTPSPSPSISASPSPSTTPDPDPSPSPHESNDRMSFRTRDKTVSAGDEVPLRGRLVTDLASCAAQRNVILKSRRPGGRFVAQDQGRTDARGRITFTPTVRRTRDFRVVAKRSGGCDTVKSRIVRVQVRR